MASEMRTPFEKCCRTCLKEDALMFDLFIESSNIADLLVSCTKLRVQKDDSLPKQICRYCYSSLISFARFCEMAQIAEEKLKEAMLTSNGLQLNNSQGIFQIKVENCDHGVVDNVDIFESQEDDYHDEQALCQDKNSETLNSNVSNNNCKAKEAKLDNIIGCYCNKHFSKLSQLKNHKEKYLNKIQNRRKLCKETKHSENAVCLMINDGNPSLNVKNELRYTDFTCDICSSKFESLSLLSAHIKHHDEKEWTSSYDELFNKDSLKQHEINQTDLCSHLDVLNTITPKENVNTNISEQNTDQFQCSKCLLIFKNINSLSAHMRKHTEKGRIISCNECNKVFKKLSHLKRHEIQHKINCPYKCTVCPKSFPTEEALRDHMNKHRGVKPHECPVCGKKFSHLSTLTAHVKIHTRDKAFLCPTCGKKFDTSTNLKQHISRHIGLKEFACTLCPKTFVSKGELKSHTITHTGERSYTCDQCGATFTKRSSLTKHTTRHLGLKPYQCGTCLMRFTCKDHLKRHYRIHTGEKPYKCDMCERAFTQSNDLVKHRRSHLGDNVYKCPQCTESFRLKAELRQHISEHFISSQNMHAMNVPKEPPEDGQRLQTAAGFSS